MIRVPFYAFTSNVLPATQVPTGGRRKVRESDNDTGCLIYERAVLANDPILLINR